MSAAEHADCRPDDPPALREAIRLLHMGLWPVPITAPDDDRPWVGTPGKQPAHGKGWGKVRYTEEMLRNFWASYPHGGVGLKLGKVAGVVDVEVDDPRLGPGTFATLMGGEEDIETMGWSAAKGAHRLFRWDDRLARYGAVIEGDPRFPGLGLRFGSADEEGKQVQSVCPPSPITHKVGDKTLVGEPRRWNGVETIADLPDEFFAVMDRLLAQPRAQPEGPPPTIPFAGNGQARVEPLSDAVSNYVAKAYQDELDKLKAAPEGDRNNQLNRSAFAIGQFVGAGLISESGAAQNLLFFARQAGLGDRESQATIRSGLSDGKAEPRDVSHVGQKAPKPSFVNSATETTFSPDDEWDRLLLWEPLPPEPFPLDALPIHLADLCREGAEAMQCPPDFFGAAALALAGATLGLSVNLTLTSTWIEAPNLYVAIVGPPGSKKTPAIKLMSRPLYRIDAELRDEYRRDATRYQEDQREYEAQKRKGNPGAPPIAPIPVQITMDDVTREALAHIHSENPRGLAVILDELTAWVASLDAYRGGKGADKQFWLKANSGSLVKVSRRGTRDAIVIPHPCLTVVGGLTPGMLPGIRDNDRDDGWLDRILFAFPDPTYRSKRWVERNVPDDLIQGWSDAVQRLWNRPMQLDGPHPRPYFIRMTERAKASWVEWFDAHNAEQDDPEFPAHLRGPWSKLEGFTARLALILSQLHQAYDPEGGGPPRDVDILDIRGARKLSHYFKAHFRRARAELSRRPGDESEESKAILRWIKAEHLTTFSGRDVSRHFHRFEEVDRMRALAWLCSRNVIRQRATEPQPGKVGRKPTFTYDVNPETFE